MAKNKKNNKNNKKMNRSFSIFLKILLAVFILLLIASLMKTCFDCRNVRRCITILDQTGYLPEKENWDVIPNVVPPYDDKDFDSLADKVSLEAFFPPIGDQGEYGTCVAWSVGYNLKTALNAIDNHWTQAQLADPANQTSPKDLWMGIPLDKKGPSCRGTGFAAAFNVLMNEGVSNMARVPYKQLGNCQGSIEGDTTNRIVSYNHVVSSTDGKPTVEQLKAYLHDTIPLAFSAKLGYAFKEWNSDRTLRQDNYLMRGDEHAYHAMVLVGYDDSRQAFRVRNSWGEDWGDHGSIWIDYTFFIDQFLDAVFMAKNH